MCFNIGGEVDTDLEVTFHLCYWSWPTKRWVDWGLRFFLKSEKPESLVANALKQIRLWLWVNNKSPGRGLPVWGYTGGTDAWQHPQILHHNLVQCTMHHQSPPEMESTQITCTPFDSCSARTNIEVLNRMNVVISPITSFIMLEGKQHPLASTREKNTLLWTHNMHCNYTLAFPLIWQEAIIHWFFYQFAEHTSTIQTSRTEYWVI